MGVFIVKRSEEQANFSAAGVSVGQEQAKGGGYPQSGRLITQEPSSPPSSALDHIPTARVTAAAPSVEHRLELQLEVLNVHFGPARNLTITMPLTVRVQR